MEEMVPDGRPELVRGSRTTLTYLTHRSLRPCRSRVATPHRWMSRVTTSLRTGTMKVSDIIHNDGLNIVERKWLWAFP